MKMSGLARPFTNVTSAMFDHATSKVRRREPDAGEGEQAEAGRDHQARVQRRR